MMKTETGKIHAWNCSHESTGVGAALMSQKELWYMETLLVVKRHKPNRGRFATKELCQANSGGFGVQDSVVG